MDFDSFSSNEDYEVKALYKYSILPLVYSKNIEGELDNYIAKNSAYLPQDESEIDYSTLPYLNNLIFPVSIRYHKLLLCLNALQNKQYINKASDEEINIELKEFIQKLLKIGYNKIFRYTSTLSLSLNSLEKFFEYNQNTKRYINDDETYINYSILLYVYSASGKLNNNNMDLILFKKIKALTDHIEIVINSRETQSISFENNKLLYSLLSNVDNSSHYEMDFDTILSTKLINESCFHFFLSLKNEDSNIYDAKQINKFRNELFKDSTEIQAKHFIETIFNFKGYLGLTDSKKNSNIINIVLDKIFRETLLMGSDLESLLTNTFLSIEDLKVLYMQLFSSGELSTSNQSINSTLNNKISCYCWDCTYDLRVNLIYNIMNLCHFKHINTLESNYKQSLFNISKRNKFIQTASTTDADQLELNNPLYQDLIAAKNSLQSFKLKEMQYNQKIEYMQEEIKQLKAQLLVKNNEIKGYSDELSLFHHQLFSVVPDSLQTASLHQNTLDATVHKIAFVGGDEIFRKKIESVYRNTIIISPDQLHISLTPLIKCNVIVFITSFNSHAQFERIKNFLKKNNCLDKLLLIDNQPNLNILNNTIIDFLQKRV